MLSIADKSPPRKNKWSWRSQAFRGVVYQFLAIGVVALGIWLLASNTMHNMQVRGLCYAYVEMFRNVPILLQLFMWYLLLAEGLPVAQDALTFGRFFLSKGGLIFPKPIWEIGHLWGAFGLVAGAILAFACRRWAFHKFESTG